MRIGIMSMQRIVNYGSYLQAYSLKKMLEELGSEVCFVDYKVEPVIELRQYYKHVSFGFLRQLKRKLKLLVSPPQKPFVPDSFIACYPKLGLDTNRHVHTKVDTLIIGSDEVLNCLQTNPNVGYSLELFGKRHRAKKLISYAASCGDTTLERLQEYEVDGEVGYYLNKFDAISVRDYNSASIVKTLTEKEPFQHLDPVLVGNVEKEDWVPCLEKNFIIVYGYGHRFSAEEGKKIMEFASKRHLKVITMCAEQKFGDEFVYCRPDEILGYFANAEYVITDTFHGTIFSVLFHKPVAVFCRTVKDVSYSNENKLMDLLEKLYLQNQLVNDISKLEEILDQKIDYSKIDRIRENERRCSLEYLKQYCGKGE